VLAQWTGADTPSAELDIVEIAHRRTASAAATDSPGRAKLRSAIHLAPYPKRRPRPRSPSHPWWLATTPRRFATATLGQRHREQLASITTRSPWPRRRPTLPAPPPLAAAIRRAERNIFRVEAMTYVHITPQRWLRRGIDEPHLYTSTPDQVGRPGARWQRPGRPHGPG